MGKKWSREKHPTRFFTARLDEGVYSDDETEFIRAMEQYQREHHTRFPTYTEILSVVKNLGYRKDVPSS